MLKEDNQILFIDELNVCGLQDVSQYSLLSLVRILREVSQSLHKHWHAVALEDTNVGAP